MSVQTTKENTVGDGATKKPAAKRAAASKTSDEELLAQQAAEELEEIAAPDPGPVDQEALAQQMSDLEAAERAGKVSVLRTLHLARDAGGPYRSDEWLLEHEAEILNPPAPGPDPDEPVVPSIMEGLHPAVVAMMAQQQAQTNALLEKMTEIVGAQASGQGQVGLSPGLASAEDLVAQLEGTMSDGGPGEVPLERPVTFVAKGKALLVIKKPRFRGVGPSGEQFFTRGIAADFAPTGTFTTTNPEMVAFLKARPGFNREYWELGAEPFSPPNPKIIMDRIIEATLSLDDAALEELEREEQASHKRGFVLDALQTARNRVQGVNGQAAD